MKKVNLFGAFPLHITMPPPTDKEDAEMAADNADALKLFVNQDRKQEKPLITLPMALLIVPVPAILLLFGALALGWRP